MSNVTHLRFEIVRTFRNRTFLGVTLALPLVLFYGVASGQRHATFDRISFPLYFMTAMAVYGAMFAAVSPGSRVARDRSGGWIRHCGSRHCGPAPTSPPRCSPLTWSRCPAWRCSTWPVRRSGCGWVGRNGWK